MDKEQYMIDDVGRQLARKGIRVITLAALHDQIQREAARRGRYAPSWARMVDVLRGMPSYTISELEDYAVTLPDVETEGGRRPCMLDAVHRVLDGIDAFDADDTRILASGALKLIDWVREQLAAAAPAREE